MILKGNKLGILVLFWAAIFNLSSQAIYTTTPSVKEEPHVNNIAINNTKTFELYDMRDQTGNKHYSSNSKVTRVPPTECFLRQRFEYSQHLDLVNMNDDEFGNYSSFCEGQPSCKNRLFVGVRNKSELIMIYLNKTYQSASSVNLDLCDCVTLIRVIRWQ